MPRQIVTARHVSAALTARYAAIREELGVPGEFPPEVLAETERVLREPLLTVDRDETAVPFCTIDPPGSMDLDQALHIERVGRNYRVRYAIAHVASFIEPGGAGGEAEALATVGPVNVYRRQLGEYRVIVMGEVPALAVRRLGDGIERRRK